MKSLKTFICIGLIGLASVPLSGFAQLTWPSGKQCAIVLTYDDGLSSQLDHAIPQLDSLNLKGTFFLTGGLSTDAIESWRTAALNGHELGNHTLFHPCSENAYENNARYYSENYSIEIILSEIRMMNSFLFAIDGATERTYAYPCSETVVGGQDYTQALAETQLIKYARIGGDRNSIITDVNHINPLLIPSWGATDNPSDEELIDFVERVREQQGLGVLMFHGVGGDYLAVTSEAHQKLIQFLYDHREVIWTATFNEAMDYVSLQLPHEK